MNQFKWRGTWGFGDAMMALNTAHHYSYSHDTPVELEMHWSHDEDYKLDARDTQNLINFSRKCSTTSTTTKNNKNIYIE